MRKISRETNVALNWVLNELVPPYLRDRRWFGWIITTLLYGKQAHHFMRFHSRVYAMSDEEFAEIYRQISAVSLDRETDLNRQCIARIRSLLIGDTVLEAGCGKGHLSRIMAESGMTVTACDIAMDASLAERYPHITWYEGNTEALPFPDASFDMVVSTHVLEHVRNIQASIRELRRLARRRLIVVLPCERPHFYTPSLHIHFFPYPYSLHAVFGTQYPYHLEKQGGDWVYWEDYDTVKKRP